jgi:hypothetical protein
LAIARPLRGARRRRPKTAARCGFRGALAHFRPHSTPLAHFLAHFHPSKCDAFSAILAMLGPAALRANGGLMRF